MVKDVTLAQLVCKAQEGKKDVFNQIYELTNNQIYYFALKMVKNPDDALDIVQDSYISAFSKINTLKNPEAFLSWMYRITANNCKKTFIKSKNNLSLFDEDNKPYDNIEEDNEEFLPQIAIENNETRRIIMNIIDSLPDAQRTCIMMYYFSEMSVATIAEIMECSEGTIKSRLNYGRKQIKQAVLEFEEKEDTRLHVFLPFGEIVSLFKDIPDDIFKSTQGTENVWESISTKTPQIRSAASGASSAIRSNGAKGGILATVKAKVLAGVIGLTMITTGVMISVNSEPALNFTDPAFEEGIRAAIQKPEGELYKKDLDEIWGMDVDSEGFKFIQGHESHGPMISGQKTDSIKNSYSLEDVKYLNDISFVTLQNISVDSLAPLSDKGVVSLFLSDVDVKEWDSLSKLSDLESIHISYSSDPPFTKVPDMSDLKKLKEFSMSPQILGKSIVPLDISSISEVQSLIILDIDGVSIKDLSPLSQLKDLKSLSLRGGTIHDVAPLAKLDNLMIIDINSSQQIEGRETFRRMTGLRVLSVSDSGGMSLSKEEWEERQMDIEGVEVNYNHFDRNIQEKYTEVMNEIRESMYD